MRANISKIILIGGFFAAAVFADTSNESQRYAADVSVLAADDMEGRGLGTAGIARAADWIEARLRAIGLQPAFGASYRQALRVKVGVRKIDGNRLDGVTETDWTPLGFSSAGEFAGELAFVGYGIEAPALGFDELAGIDLQGKIVLVLRFEPQEGDEGSIFDGRKPSRWSALRYRVHRLRERGARAVIFTTGPLQDEGQDYLPELKNDGPKSPAGLPVMQVKRSVAEKWLAGKGIDLGVFQRELDRDLRPRSVAATGIRLAGRVAVEPVWAEAENVVGIVPGRGALAADAIVIGAHYDHLGMGGEGSLKPNEHAIHNGADDNASGTVAVLHAAARLANVDGADRRTVIVALFSGEESGLAGSGYFVEHPPLPIERVKAMLNLDMVGRLREEGLVALGSETAPEWTPAVERLAKAETIKVTTKGDGYGPSDQTSFYAAKIPVLHFFTGAHTEYHTPADDSATINADGGARIARFVAALGNELASGAITPTYTRASSAPLMEGDTRGFGSYLGTIPDYSAMESETGGVLLADVRAGGPADLAGLKGGDRIVAMAGTRIDNLHDMTFVLADHKPGQTITVRVIRAGQTLDLKATLGDRRTQAKEPGPAAHPVTPATPKEQVAPAQPAPATDSAPTAFELPAFYEGRPGADFVVAAGQPFPDRADEPNLHGVRQLTFAGENAEAYFSPDGRSLIYQLTKPGGCDQQYVMDLTSGESRLVSTGRGRTTCGYYDWPEGDRIVYASTHGASPDCPPIPDKSAGYVWPLYESYDLWEAMPDGSAPKRLTASPGYDAEATWCHRGGQLVFTSVRDGDLDLYAMDEAGTVKRLTNTPGYDGGAFFSPDCRQIVWRAGRPEGEELTAYRELLAKGLVRPRQLDIYVMDADGGNVRQLTTNGQANFGPYFHPDGRRIIYSSNAGAPKPWEFDLWIVSTDGGEPQRVTRAESFDGFPVWSPDGRFLVWGSNRANPQGHETNLFIARWHD